MEKQIILNKKIKEVQIPLKAENPFLMITKIIIPALREKGFNSGTFLQGLSIKHQVKTFNGGSESATIFSSDFENSKIISSSVGSKFVKLELNNPSDIDTDVIVYFTQFDQKVDLKDSLEDFNTHISWHDNVKILFSAPFGQGKTTFLKRYFEKHFDEYEVFKLYPVNYAVSHNEDIFKYIKIELLFQLLEKGADFEKENFSYWLTAPEYIKTNIAKIISPFLASIPKVGKDISSIYDNFLKLITDFLTYHKQIQVDSEKKVIDYIKEAYEKEGSIFEDNFYTQLIRELLVQLKLKGDKQKNNVLIIDDIDRMDPDHIFRIFNVFSANFDSDEYTNDLSDKFGFDKIILVCDYQNIKKVFAHRYGSNVSFDGYLSKYYSLHPYNYDNKKAVEFIISQLLIYNGKPLKSKIGDALHLIIRDLIYAEELKLRELLKLMKFNFYDYLNIKGHTFSNSMQMSHKNLPYFVIIGYLKDLFGLENLAEKFEKCKTRVYKRNRNYDYYTQIGLIPLSINRFNDNEDIRVLLNGKKYEFDITHEFDSSLNNEFYKPKHFKESADNYIANFNVSDFYEMLIQNIEKYKEG